MDESKECKVVQDLFPSYIEKLTDEKTNEFIEEHIKKCVSCKEKLEGMQNNIDVQVPNQANKDVKFLKKYKTKLRIFQYIVLAILLFVIFGIGRRYIILTSLENKARNTINENNYYIKTVSQSIRMYIWESSFSPNPEDSITNSPRIEIHEEYYKDGTKLSNRYNYQMNDEGNEISKISLGDDTYVRYSINTHKNGLINPYTEDFAERLSDSFFTQIKKIEFAGRKCYIIQIANGAIETYIDAETGLRIKTINNEFNYSEEYYYSFGTVTDNDVKEPDEF